jgi:uncharacterized protein (TIGR02466 family)
MPFCDIAVKQLFPTPVMIASFPPDIAAQIKGDLVPLILDKAKREETKNITNIGGWQSDTHIAEWGGAPVQMIVKAFLDLIEQNTMNLLNPDFALNTPWIVNGWANVNRKGHYNVPHLHAGAYWSAIYYLQVDDNEGGELEISDPRGALPIMAHPNLRYSAKEFRSCGGHELHKPHSGQCILFPSWLTHAVRPYKGDGTRISLAFNFAVGN